jgi:hypothetical protein
MGGPGGFDPSQMDPAMLMQVSQMLQRLPKGQMQKLQSIMQRAMTGKDVTREAQELERLLPPDFLEAMKGFSMPGMPGMPTEETQAAAALPVDIETTAFAPATSMSADEARAIVEQAVRDGKVTSEQAADLIASGPTSAHSSTEESKKGSFWSRFTGKK